MDNDGVDVCEMKILRRVEMSILRTRDRKCDMSISRFLPFRLLVPHAIYALAICWKCYKRNDDDDDDDDAPKERRNDDAN